MRKKKLHLIEVNNVEENPNEGTMGGDFVFEISFNTMQAFKDNDPGDMIYCRNSHLNRAILFISCDFENLDMYLYDCFRDVDLKLEEFKVTFAPGIDEDIVNQIF